MADSQKIERELFGSASDFSDEEIQYEVRIQANTRQIFGEAFPSFLRELLVANLSSQTPVEMEIGQATNKAIETLKWSRPNCGCSTCIRDEICRRLKKAGYNSTICKSKWKESSEILGGEHTYIQVTAETTEGSKKKKTDIRIIVELNFRDEFMIVRPTKGYHCLVSLLPRVFVGKTQKLRNLVKIMCSALELCMEEKNMHMGLWRKENYMLAKWQGRPEDSEQQERLKNFASGFREEETEGYDLFADPRVVKNLSLGAYTINDMELMNPLCSHSHWNCWQFRFMKLND